MIPCDPIPLSRRPCKEFTNTHMNLMIDCLSNLSNRPYLSYKWEMEESMSVCFQSEIWHNFHSNEWAKRDGRHTWKGKWSGPRAGAPLIWIVPDSMASLIMMALLISLVKMQPWDPHTQKTILLYWSKLHWSRLSKSCQDMKVRQYDREQVESRYPLQKPWMFTDVSKQHLEWATESALDLDSPHLMIQHSIVTMGLGAVQVPNPLNCWKEKI